MFLNFRLLFCFLISLISVEAFSQRDLENYNQSKGIAIEGYDPVAYFDNDPKKGKKEYALSYKGLKYQFANEQNKEAFKSNPRKYEPQYGGWCAYAMGNDGSKVDIDPDTYKIVDGKLYLFYNRFFTNTLDYWNEDEINLKNKADDNWMKLEGE